MPFLLSEEVRDVFSHVYIARDLSTGHVVGAGMYALSNADNHVYELCMINVHPDYQGQGIGRKIISFILNELLARSGELECKLVVLTAKGTLCQYYQPFGFDIKDKLDDEYFMSLDYREKWRRRNYSNE